MLASVWLAKCTPWIRLCRSTGVAPLRGRPKAVGGGPVYAALNHAAVSKALLINGMFMPKLGFTPFFETTTLGAGFATITLSAWAVSAARSHDPISGERATEKNRST